MPTVVLIGTLDTKGPEYAFMRDSLHAAGVGTVVVDIGILGKPSFEPDVSAADVATAVGVPLESLRFAREGSDTRAAAFAVMEQGAAVTLLRLRGENRCDGALGAGGAGGSTIISAAMRALPIGIPKLLVSTMAGKHADAFVGTRDICLMNAVTDIAGLNRVSRQVLGNAARAVAGMVAAQDRTEVSAKPLVALTMLGVTTPGVLRIQERLHEAGFETIVFHTVGTGGRAMEEMIDQGLIDGVIDYTVNELTSEFLGGAFGAGPGRLEAAGRKSLPQVVVPGAIEVLNFGPRATVPPQFDTPERRLIVHTPQVSAVRTSRDEAVALARLLAVKVNGASGPVAVLLPLRGLDRYQQPPDGPFIEPEADEAFFAVLRDALRREIDCRSLPLNINDAAFADAAFEAFLALWNRGNAAARDQQPSIR